MMVDVWRMVVAFGPTLAFGLASVLVKGAVLLSVTALAARALARTRSAAVRHLVWVTGIGALLLLPVLSGVLPRWQALPALVRQPALAFDVSEEAVAASPALAFDVSEDAAAPAVRDVTVPSVLEPVAVAGVGTSVTAAPSVGARGGDALAFTPLPPALEGSARFRLDSVSMEGSAWWALLLLWAGGAGLLGLTTIVGLVRVAALERGTAPLTGARWDALLEDACADMGVTRTVRLVEGEGIPVPMTWGLNRPVVALPADARFWSDDRLRQALLHELAHVVRGDQPVMLLARLICALHWMNPLSWVALHQLRAESEQAADDRVLSVGTRASDYAAGLIAVARGLPARQELPAAAFAMARSSQLGGRVEAILDPARRRAGATRWDVLAVVIVLSGFAVPLSALAMRSSEPTLAGLVELVPPLAPDVTVRVVPDVGVWVEVPAVPSPVVAPLAPGLPGPEPVPVDVGWVEPALTLLPHLNALPHAAQTDPCFDPDHRVKSDQVNVDDERMRAFWATAACTWELEVRGEVRFSEDESGIEALSRGGRFELEQSGQGARRRIRIESGGNGRLERQYWVDRDERPFDEAAGWLAQVIPEVYRVTGLDAEARVQRILARGGVPAVLQEVGHIRSGYTTRIYLSHLLATGGLSPSEVAAALDTASEQISSDYEMAELLTRVQHDLASQQVRVAYLHAARTIESDYEMRRTLEALLREDLTPAETGALIELAADIGSDFEVVELLVKLARQADMDDATLTAFLDVIQSVESDYEARRALAAALSSAPLSDGNVDRLLDRVDTMDSDFERAEVLLDLVGRLDSVGDRVRQRLLDSADRLSSDHERGRVLSAVARAR
ncbi:MAG: M56 family metallopeptidase [Gemmatimonadota bacterium]